MSRFVDNFWDTDFNSTNGYDVLLKRMKDGREMCKGYEEFLKQRAKAEDTFGRTLLRISKAAGGKDEIGTLRSAWSEVVTQTENCGQSHIDISVRLIEEAKKVEDFRETQKEIRVKNVESIKKLITAKKDQYNRVMHSKKNYETKCRELDAAEETYMRGRLVSPQKELEKMAAKKDKARQVSISCDTQYQKDVTTLEQTRQQWEEQMTQLCVIFQQLEMERIRFLRNAMWVFANVVSLQCCSDDENSENMRKALLNCKEDVDIEQFVSLKSTGSIRPAPVVYECYYKDNVISKPGISNGRSRQTLPAPPGSRAEQNPQKRALPVPPPLSPPKEGIYSSMSEYSTGVVGEFGSKEPKKYMALFEYEAQGPEEMTLKAGDILTIVSKEDDTWWYAESNGKRGHVPANYLGPHTDTGEEGHNTFL